MSKIETQAFKNFNDLSSNSISKEENVKRIQLVIQYFARSKNTTSFYGSKHEIISALPNDLFLV